MRPKEDKKKTDITHIKLLTFYFSFPIRLPSINVQTNLDSLYYEAFEY